MKRFGSPLVFMLALVFCPTIAGAEEVIDFEGLAEGTVVDQVFSAGGVGPVLVDGSNDKFPPGQNAAIIFDSSCPPDGKPRDCSGEDQDLGTPNETFGGPGVGDQGSAGSSFENREALGNLLIIGEDLADADGDGRIDDPDDEGTLLLNKLTFDFSEVGAVTVHRIALVDINFTGAASSIELLDKDGALLGSSPYTLPRNENNGVVPDFGLDNTPGVSKLVVNLRGSGAVDNLVFSRQGPRITLEKHTNGQDADDPNGKDVPFVTVGGSVEWTYQVTNTGTESLTDIVVTDDRGVEVSCPEGALEPGASMLCTASGVAEDFGQEGYETVTGVCRSRPGKPVYENWGTAEAVGVDSGASVKATDPSHYCSGPEVPDICVRKQSRGPDTRAISSGDDIDFKVVVWNCGTMALTDVKVADVLVPGCNDEFDRLGVGESRTITCTASGLAIGGDNVDGCTFENEVVATGMGGKQSVTDSDTSTVELVGLEIKKTFTGVTEGANFDIVVTNNGCDLDSVRVTDRMAPGCERDIGALAAGESHPYKCSMPLENEACAEGTRGGNRVTDCDTAVIDPDCKGCGDDDDDDGGGDDDDDDKDKDKDKGKDGGKGDKKKPSSGLLLLVLALLVGGGLFAWNRMKVG